MPTFSLDFSEKLIEAAVHLQESDSESIDGQRTTLYLSLLSCEITLKALLEKAGYHPFKEIKKLSHDLSKLLAEFSNCEITKEVVSGKEQRVPATSIRSLSIRFANEESTTGDLICVEKEGVSIYPNEIRYGNELTHFPAPAMLQVAQELLRWAEYHIGTIQRKY